MQFVSTRGETPPVDFETAVLRGYAPDGGLYVPATIPNLSPKTLERWAHLGYVDLAHEILSLFIEPSAIPTADLRRLLEASYRTFDTAEVAPVVPLGSVPRRYVMELFHGPTLSFKDLAMGVLVNIVDFLLQRRKEWQTLIVVTTGDTGPAAAHASAGKGSLECWVLYPSGMISEEQTRQMTTIRADNVHAVGVSHCPNGGDDLDLLVAELSADRDFSRRLRLSSVNSINLCRVLAQTIHFFYGYFRVAESPGERIVISVPSGGFGNMFGGCLARMMGLPIEFFVCATNSNATLHRIFSRGEFSKAGLRQTLSSAIDIVIPYNFWRYLYLASGRDHEKIRRWMDEFQAHGRFELDACTAKEVQRGFWSASISDSDTLATIQSVYETTGGYLLDPHAAVSVAAAQKLSERIPSDAKVVSFATAHPAKFPKVIRRALAISGDLPPAARHHSIDAARQAPEKYLAFTLDEMRLAIRREMESAATRRKAGHM
jgi:threonine synthase